MFYFAENTMQVITKLNIPKEPQSIEKSRVKE